MAEAFFDVDDVSWIASEARRLWAEDTDRSDNRLDRLIAQDPQPILRIPEWMDFGLDPFGPAYRDQILLLWRTLFERGTGSVGTVYNAAEHEQDAAYDLCPIRFPGFFARRDPGAVSHAGYELAMIGDIFVHSRLAAGKHALEYGAGSGNIAINLSRMGVHVDTVDISATYCSHIDQNADFYKIGLKSFNAEFGENPRGDEFRYDCILFHACFHHSLDHADLVRKIAGHIKNDGIIILSNEPVFETFYAPWGLRLDPECISVVAGRGWMELGFKFDYLRDVFFLNGLILYRIEKNFSGVPLFAARKYGRHVAFDDASLVSHRVTGGYAPEPTGMWTSGSVTLPLADLQGAGHARIEIANLLPQTQHIDYVFRGKSGHLEVPSESAGFIEVPLHTEGYARIDDLTINSSVLRPCDCIAGSADQRELGVVLRSLHYI